MEATKEVKHAILYLISAAKSAGRRICPRTMSSIYQLEKRGKSELIPF